MSTIYGDGFIADRFTSDYERLSIESDERARAVQGLKDEFLAAARRGNLKALATWAPTVKRWYSGDGMVTEYQTEAEIFSDSLDYETGPHIEQVFSILCAVAYGSEPQVMAARELLDRMAGKWADFAYRGE